MFLLTEGPRLFYVDAEKMVLKGEIPFGKELRTEPKDFKVFFIHVPNRTYYLIDREGFAMEWVHEINAVWTYYFSSESEPTSIVGPNEAIVTTTQSSVDLGKRGGSGGIEKMTKNSSQFNTSSSIGDSMAASAQVDVDPNRKTNASKK